MNENTKNKTGVELIVEERERQIAKEGFTGEHDDQWRRRELAKAALVYLAFYLFAGKTTFLNIKDAFWPWLPEDWKPASKVRVLAKAGALIGAEIDRYRRVDEGAVLKV